MYMFVLQEHVPCTVLKDVLDSQAAIERQQREAAEQLAKIRALVASIKKSSRDVSSGSTSATNNDCRKESNRKKSNGKKITGKKVTGKKVTVEK